MKNEIDKFLFRQKQCLSFMGCSLRSTINKESIFEKYRQPFFIFLVISSLYPIINYGIYNSKNIDLLTASLSLVLIALLNVTKMTTLLVNKAFFFEIMNQFKDMWKNNSNAFARNRLKDVNSFSNRLVNYYFYTMIWTSFYFIASPVTKLVWAICTNQTFKRQWTTPMRFFFNLETSPGYEIGLVYTACVCLAAIPNIIAIDGLFVSFTANLSAHLCILQNSIATNEFTETPQNINTDICSFVKYHTLIIDLADKICQAYIPIIFGQFLMTSLQVCVITYQISKHMDNFVLLIANVCFLCTVMMQLFAYCYGGEIIKFESLNVGTSVQLSKWYRLQPKYRKMLCLLMLRSQKPIVLQSGFYDASLASFMLIIKAASSYITLIKSLE